MTPKILQINIVISTGKAVFVNRLGNGDLEVSSVAILNSKEVKEAKSLFVTMQEAIAS